MSRRHPHPKPPATTAPDHAAAPGAAAPPHDDRPADVGRFVLRDMAAMFDLKRDQDSNEAIDQTIRAASQARGTNLWVLFLAILMASVGLNVNSTAVIIGAMLISPLMGPIIGIGYGLGINDFHLIRRALRNLALFVLLALTASTLYFLISPLAEARSELLARTSPNIWDVLIALIGGAAGMIALSRRESSTVIPGVAIATALMPPLCTAGFGLARGEIEYFLGAFYLFLINSVFIAYATLLVVKLLKLPKHEFASDAARRNARNIVAAVVTITLLPSAWLATLLVQHEVFDGKARTAIQSVEEQHPEVVLIDRKLNASEREIGLTVIGQKDAGNRIIDELQIALAAQGLDDVKIRLRQPRNDDSDLTSLRREMRTVAMEENLRLLQERNQRIENLEKQLNESRSAGKTIDDISQELRAHYPEIGGVIVADGVNASRDGSKPAVVVALTLDKRLAASELQRIEHWLRNRLADRTLILSLDPKHLRILPPAQAEPATPGH